MSKSFLGYGRSCDFSGENLMEVGRRVYRFSPDHFCSFCAGEGCKKCNQQGTTKPLNKSQIQEKIKFLITLGGFERQGNRFKKTVNGRVTRNRVIRGQFEQLCFLEKETRVYRISGASSR